MFESVTGNSLWYLVKQSDFVSKFILLVLLCMSIACWTIFIAKLILFRLRLREMKRVNEMLSTFRSTDDLVAVNVHVAGTIGGQLISNILGVSHMFRDVRSSSLAYNRDIMQYHIDQTVDVLIAGEESYLPVLSTSAAVATLLGLLGTVWGLIHSFVRISEKQAADITVVAPGIAEALTTTLAGLIVAIPALVMYNYLLIRVRQLENTIVQLADRVAFVVYQTFGG